MTYPNHFIYDLFQYGSTATHAIDVVLRDRHCNKAHFTIPIKDPNEFDMPSIADHSEWYVKAFGYPYECTFD